MRLKPFLSALTAIILVLTVVTGCSQNNPVKSGDNSQKAESTTLKIGSLTIEENLPLLVAEKNGYFAAENIQVHITDEYVYP